MGKRKKRKNDRLRFDYFDFYDEVIEDLEKKGKYGVGYCPFHDDRHSGHGKKSFKFFISSGYFKCMQPGCWSNSENTDEAWRRAEEFSNLYKEEFGGKLQSPDYNANRTKRYYGYDGDAIKVRYTKDKGFCWEGNEAAANKTVYLPEMIDLARSGGKELWICEGENDTELMVSLGKCAVGLPSATDYGLVWNLDLTGIRSITIAMDNDLAGRKPREILSKRIPYAKWVKWTKHQPNGFDLSDLFEHGRVGEDPKKFFAILKKRTKTNKVQLNELFNQTFAPLKWVVEGTIPEGLTLIGGGTKEGKSFLVTNIAMAATHNLPFLGKTVAQTPVLFLGLEESDRRFQSRTHDILGKWSGASDKFYFFKEWPRVGDGGLRALRDMVDHIITECDESPLVIIDTLSLFDRLRSKSSYDIDYSAIREIKYVGDDYKTSVLVVTHTVKEDRSDPAKSLQGTIGTVAGADTIVVMKRDPSGTMILQTRPREAKRQDLAIQFDESFKRWELLGDAKEVAATTQQKILLEAVKSFGDQAFEPKEVKLETHGKLRPEYVEVNLTKLVDRGIIRKVRRGLYQYVTPVEDTVEEYQHEEEEE